MTGIETPCSDSRQGYSDTVGLVLDTSGKYPELHDCNSCCAKHTYEIIPIDLLAIAPTDSKAFNQKVYAMVADKIREEFQGLPYMDTIIKRANSERPLISVFTMAGMDIYGSILGVDREKALLLAAVVQTGWGLIIENDGLVDQEMLKKGLDFSYINEGQADSIQQIIAVSAYLGSKLWLVGDGGYMNDHYFDMLRIYSMADIKLRSFDWDTKPETMLPVMQHLNQAFTWPLRALYDRGSQYYPQTCDFVDSLGAFIGGMSQLSRAGQLLNDVEDPAPALGKKEPMADLGQRVTMMMQAVDRLLPPDQSKRYRQIHTEIKTIKLAGQNDPATKSREVHLRQEAQTICAPYLATAVEQLMPVMQDIINKAKSEFQESFDLLMQDGQDEERTHYLRLYFENYCNELLQGMVQLQVRYATADQ